jgi:hypothetical protein
LEKDASQLSADPTNKSADLVSEITNGADANPDKADDQTNPVLISPDPAKTGTKRIRHDYSEEPRCRQGIPLAVKITKEKELCPWLGEGKASFYDLIRDGILFQFHTKGLKEGVSSVYGPSLCDAKYGCSCGHRYNLERLRKVTKKTEKS